MVQIVINYDPGTTSYKVWEPSTENLILTQDLTEALVTLSLFLQSKGLITGDILSTEDISYHLDAHTMKAIIESNVKLIKRLQNAPTGFQKSSQRFGVSNSSVSNKGKGFKDSGGRWNGGESKRKFGGRSKSQFEGATGFKNSNKKFYGKNKSSL